MKIEKEAVPNKCNRPFILWPLILLRIILFFALIFSFRGVRLAGLFGRKQDQPVHDDLRAALLLSFFVFPVTGVQATFHVERTALLHAVRGEGGERTPADQLVELRLALAFAGSILPRTIRGEADDTERTTGLGRHRIGIARGVPEQCDAIHIEHKNMGERNTGGTA